MRGEETTIQLSTAAQLYIRPGPAIQFGVDSRRAGIFDALTAATINTVTLALLTARNPVPLRTITAGLTAAGLSEAGVHSLIEDLLHYRILCTIPPRPTVAIIGNGPLEQRITSLLQQRRINVRQPIPGEDLESFFTRIDAQGTTPVITIQQPSNIAEHLSKYARTWLPISIVDGRGQLGPFHIDNVGPCPMCLDLHRTDIDPSWYILDPWETPPPQDQITLMATAARAAACIHTLLDYSVEPPGCPPLRLQPGEMQEINPYGDVIHRWLIEPHPSCPVCWDMGKL